MNQFESRTDGTSVSAESDLPFHSLYDCQNEPSILAVSNKGKMIHKTSSAYLGIEYEAILCDF